MLLHRRFLSHVLNWSDPIIYFHRYLDHIESFSVTHYAVSLQIVLFPVSLSRNKWKIPQAIFNWKVNYKSVDQMIKCLWRMSIEPTCRIGESFWSQTDALVVDLKLFALKLRKSLERRLHASNGFHSCFAVALYFFTHWTARVYGLLNFLVFNTYGKIQRANKEEQIFGANDFIDPLRQIPQRTVHCGLCVVLKVVWQTSAIIRQRSAQADLNFFTLMSIWRNWISIAVEWSNAQQQIYHESVHFGLIVSHECRTISCHEEYVCSLKGHD